MTEASEQEAKDRTGGGDERPNQSKENKGGLGTDTTSRRQRVEKGIVNKRRRGRRNTSHRRPTGKKDS